MAGTDVSDLDQDLRRVDAVLADYADEERQLREAIENIELDLGNSAEEFEATTGKTREEFYLWRRKAKAASLHKQRRLRRLNELRADAEVQRARIVMLQLAERSGYRGQDPLKLLDALYLLTMDLLERPTPELDEQETGLLMTVRMLCGYGVPGEKVSSGS